MIEDYQSFRCTALLPNRQHLGTVNHCTELCIHTMIYVPIYQYFNVQTQASTFHFNYAPKVPWSWAAPSFQLVQEIHKDTFLRKDFYGTILAMSFVDSCLMMVFTPHDINKKFVTRLYMYNMKISSPLTLPLFCLHFRILPCYVHIAFTEGFCFGFGSELSHSEQMLVII